jgi:hypothetical protein
LLDQVLEVAMAACLLSLNGTIGGHISKPVAVIMCSNYALKELKMAANDDFASCYSCAMLFFSRISLSST